jgi:phosphoribosylformylglycinamidine (FGAM) synthase-like amidotransferase family enzyme
LQLFAKLDLFPVEIGTVRNASGKHETGSWDMKVNSKNDSPWLQYLIGYEGPIFAPISHGEGQITMTPEMLKKAEEINLIALTYFKGHMFNYQQSSKGDRYNPNASVADIAAVAWNNNFVVFPHFERLLRNLQRDDKALLQTKQILDRIYHSTPKGLYEPTYLLFKGAMDSIKY